MEELENQVPPSVRVRLSPMMRTDMLVMIVRMKEVKMIVSMKEVKMIVRMKEVKMKEARRNLI